MSFVDFQKAVQRNVNNALTPELATGIIQAAYNALQEEVTAVAKAMNEKAAKEPPPPEPKLFDLRPLDMAFGKAYKFSLGSLRFDLDALKLLHAEHWKETEGYRDSIPLDPDYAEMIEREARGSFFVLIAEHSAHGVVGNFMGYLSRSMHTQKIVCREDTLFILPEHRKDGVGDAFVGYCHEFARFNGVSEVRLTTKTTNNVGKLAERRWGYEHVANEYVKIL